MKRRYLRHMLLAGLATGLLLLIRAHVIGGYRIPSNSMAPTFLGDPGSGDRVLVDKTRFVRRAPSRWMLAVFRRPGSDTRTYVKRLVGLPGDHLLIRDGEIYSHGALLIKPDAILEEILVPVCDEAPPFRALEAFWCVVSGRVRTSSDAIEMQPGSSGEAGSCGEAVLQTRDEITDGHRDPAGSFRPGRNPVGDLEVRIRFTLAAGGGGLEVRLDEGWDRIRVAVAVGTDGRVTLPDGSEQIVPGLRAVPGREHTLRVCNADERLRVRFDGVNRHRGDYASPHRARPSPPRRNCVEIRAANDLTRVRGLRIRRDLHFTRSGTHATRVPARVGPDHYFLLGDNSSESVDSREWGPVPGAGLIGEPVLIFWPMARFRLL